MRLESSDKELTTALERHSITNEMMAPINNENNVTILTQSIFDPIDSKGLGKKDLILSQYLIISKRREFCKLIRTVQRRLFQS